jgi:HEAT repeat protein
VALIVTLGAPPLVHADADRWRSRFDSNDADEIFEAVVLAADRKDIAAVFPLLEMGIDAKFPHLAVACGEALRDIGWPGEEKNELRAAEKFLKKALNSKDSDELKNLARILGAWGHPLVDEPLGSLASSRRNEDVQVEALYMCGSLVKSEEEKFEKTTKQIGKALKSKVPDVRAAACSAAGRRGEKAFTDDIVSLIRKDREDYPGLYGVWALKEIGYTGGIGTFVHVLKANPKRVTREACLKAVTELSTKADVEELLTLTRHKKKDYRDAAALALGRLARRGHFGTAPRTGGDVRPNPPDVPPAVVDRMIDLVETEDDWEVRDAARQALLRMGDRARDAVCARLPNSIDFADEDTRLTSLELCGIFGAKGAYKKVYKTAVFDKSRTVRMFAARALEGVDASRAVKDLAELIAGHGDKKARDYELHAVRALGYIRIPSSLETLLKIIESETENEDILREVEYAMERLTGHRFGRRPDRWRRWLEKAQHPLHPMIGKYDRQANRREALEQGLYNITDETERAVENGLRWLELQQHGIGFWDGNEKGFGGTVNCEPAYTGLSLLAFLGAGYNGREGKYRETVRRAAEFLAATQFYDGGFPVTGGTDNSWIYAYLIAMGIWGITEGYALAAMDELEEPAQWGIDYLTRVQTPGGGWRYGPRYVQSDTSCTSWVLMTVKAGDLVSLEVAQRCYDGIDSWLERCSYDITGEEELPADLSTDYDYEVGSKRYFKAFVGYFELSGAEESALQQTSMTAVGMVCRFFMGWKRSHPFLIGCANYLEDYLPVWMRGLEKLQCIAWYHYFWYYGTLGMHQMGGRYWRHWNEKIRRMYPENQRRSPPELHGSWDPDTALLNGGRIFSTAMSILSLETYYRFSPLLGEVEDDEEKPGKD